jgi:hypothetical protein
MFDESNPAVDKEARAIAKRLLMIYDRDQSGAIENYEIIALMNDVYKGWNSKEATLQEADSWARSYDFNRDGRVTLEDLEKAVKKFFNALEMGPTSSQKVDDYGLELTATQYFKTDSEGNLVANLGLLNKNKGASKTKIDVGDYTKKILKRRKTETRNELLSSLANTHGEDELQKEMDLARRKFHNYERNFGGEIRSEEIGL